MKYKTGDKCIVKPECKYMCSHCKDLDFDYIEIIKVEASSVNLEPRYYAYKAIKNGETLDWCIGCYTDKHLLPYKPKKDIADIDTYAVGDIIVNEDGGTRKVLGICGEVVIVSSSSSYNIAADLYTVHEIKDTGYKFKEQDQEIIELTLEDIAKLKGVDVSKIKIKK